MDTKEFVIMLREAADFFEQHPELPLPTRWDLTSPYGLPRFEAKAEKERFFALAKLLSPCEKTNYPDSTYLNLIKRFPQFVLEYWQNRDNICTQRVIGTKKVKRQIPVGYEEKEIEEDIIEWDCPKSFLQLMEK